MSNKLRISIHEGEQRDLVEWQKFVYDSPFGNVFQTKQWADAMREAGLKTLLLVSRDGQGNIIGGLLSTYAEYLFSRLSIIPNAYIMGGPLAYDMKDEQLLEIIIRFFDKRVKKMGALASSIRTFSPLDHLMIKRLNYTQKSDGLPCTVIVDLSKSAKELWKSLHKNTRWGIRKAEKNGVVIQRAHDLNDILAYYQVYISTCKRLKISPTDYEVFEAVWEHFARENNMVVSLAKYRGKAIAGCIALRLRDRMWAWHGVSIKEYWWLHANQLLEWDVINWGVSNGAKMYDLLGIPCRKDRNHSKYGLYIYKTQFGGSIARQGEYVKTYSTLKSTAIRFLRPLISTFHKRSMK